MPDAVNTHTTLLDEDLTGLNSAESWLNGLGQFRMNLGLHRIQRLLQAMNNPQDQIPVILVAGTNGKGSVCSLLSHVLVAAGYRVGTYTSPHLQTVHERIALNLTPIESTDFDALVWSVKGHIESIGFEADDAPTYFECLTAMMYQWFQQKAVDVAVVEVGLGGRLDATNVVQRPILSTITSIGWDHMDRLGSTLAQIAGEKAGIIQPDCPVVVLDTLPTDAKMVIQSKSEASLAPVSVVSASRLQPALAKVPLHLKSRERPTAFSQQTYQDIQTHLTYPLGLLGSYQTENASLVLALVDTLRAQGFHISEDDVARGLKQARWPGRMEVFQEQRILLEGCHNPEGFLALTHTLQDLESDESLVVLSALRQNREIKPWVDLLISMAPQIKHVILTIAQDRLDLYHAPEDLAVFLVNGFSHFPKDQQPKVHCVFDTQAAFQCLTQLLETPIGTKSSWGIVCGSLYLVGQVRGWMTAPS